VNIRLSAFLPDTFIPNTDQRLIAYKRLATIPEEAEVDDLAKEWRDRYGAFPESVRNLVSLAKMRLLMKRMAILRLDDDGESLCLHFAEETSARLFTSFLESRNCAFGLPAERKVRVDIWGRDLAQRLMRLKRILQEYREHASDIKSIQ
jgi:transcription-repair coupling factor (superfamily II helicase)